jgi:hypothetical protein
MSSTATLRALSGTPLDDELVRRTVIASAHALAERTGIVIERLDVRPNEIEAMLDADEYAAVGFAAELRRATNAWYEGKFRDGPLWGTAEA